MVLSGTPLKSRFPESVFSSQYLLWVKGWGCVPLTKQQLHFLFPWSLVGAQASLPYVAPGLILLMLWALWSTSAN